MQRMNNFSGFEELRKIHPLFCYESFNYKYDGRSFDLDFHFRLSDEIQFRPHARISWNDRLFRKYNELSASDIDNLVFHIGMMELISYWKAACPPLVQIKSADLTASQVSFWKKLYFNGLGEFFYTNSIPADENTFMDLVPAGTADYPAFSAELPEKAIVPVGGGKDSSVTAGLMQKGAIDWVPMVINPREATRQVIQAAGSSDNETVIINRQIDPLLLELNRAGYLNGHTPFSALLAFYSLLAAYLTGRSDIILSNESSASEPTIPGTTINHQYSKSFEFEYDFRNYCRQFISPGFNYFSLLRPLTELQIAGFFSRMPHFFGHFKSCNAGSKTDTWCGKCPKCLFTYIILSPYIDPDRLIRLFGRNLFDDPELQGILDELTGNAETKPFECIGTIEEVNLALTSLIERYQGQPLPFLLEYYASGNRKSLRPAPLPRLKVPQQTDHFVPAKYLKLFHLISND